MTATSERLERLEREVARLKREMVLLKGLSPARMEALEELLLRRGLSFSRDGRHPAPLLPEGEEKVGRFYGLMKKYSFRIFLREIIARRSGFSAGTRWKYCSPDTVKRYLAQLGSLGLIRRGGRAGLRLVREDVVSFGETLEWFVAEFLRRELHLAAEQGGRLPGLAAGGDYDILAAAGGLVYLEVKSSPPKHIDSREISAFARRVAALRPQGAIFLVDTQLRLGDKIVPFLAEALGSRRPATARRLAPGRYLFPGHLYAVSSKPSLMRNLQFCFEDMYREKVLS